ncbi:hypothetical protein NP233_g12575 [Leucocoprinus birnbaumii]|uniref:Uncharacterized protein n=1 Tax=Leucocoprinus birnbaumii TaxID=56174 RepID=A0AAD5VG39_9AGAR|nr:hypothetical protein NP233_g12575 [Leucocoprinus birnbaumii]
MTVLKKIQEAIAKTSRHHFLLSDDTAPPSICLMAPICEKVDVLDEDNLDQDFPTTDWPVPSIHGEALVSIAETHQVLPLAVYDTNEEFIKPEKVAGCHGSF